MRGAPLRVNLPLALARTERRGGAYGDARAPQFCGIFCYLLASSQLASYPVSPIAMRTIRPSSGLANVRYEIRGDLARRANEMERLGYEIVPLNIGNPGVFGFRTPETMRLAMIENLKASEAYCHQKGVFPAREAVVMQQQSRGVRGVSADEVFMGNGVSELIDLVLRALLSTDDEVLVPSPDYPLWTAAVNLNRGRRCIIPVVPRTVSSPIRKTSKR